MQDTNFVELTESEAQELVGGLMSPIGEVLWFTGAEKAIFT